MTSELSKYLEVIMKGKQTKKGINKKTKQKEPLVYTQSFDALFFKSQLNWVASLGTLCRRLYCWVTLMTNERIWRNATNTFTKHRW
jgi:hypothetical protein